MALGKCVIATKNGGACESIQDGFSGILVPPDDAIFFAEKLYSVLTNSNFRNMLSANASLDVKKFNTEQYVNGIQNVYKSLLENSATIE
jgi:glycosyltransferase involved in cell wall biosynthesis